MKKQILLLAILASTAVSAQIYTPTGNITRKQIIHQLKIQFFTTFFT